MPQKRLQRENLALGVAFGVFTAVGFVCGFLAHGLTSSADGSISVPAPLEKASTVYSLPRNPILEFLKPMVPEDGEMSGDIPEFFDTRTQWLGCGTYVVDQRQCGDCWAASATNVLGDRFCIHLLEDGRPVPLPESGAHGAGAYERKFQQAGKCIGDGTTHAAHQHGCKRGSFFPNPQAMISCANMNNTDAPTFHPYQENSGYEPGHTLYPSSIGCNGGEANDAWRFLYHEGLTIMDSSEDGGCTTYSSGSCSGDDPLNNGCHPCFFPQCLDTGLKPERLTVDSFGWIMEEGLPARGSWQEDESFKKAGTDQPRPASQMKAMARQVRKMQIELMTNGPLHTCIDDYANFGVFFNLYPQGIYNDTEGTPLTGGHCIALIGWGTDHATGMPYWTWKNSWGTNFANGGFGRIIRGLDLIGLESDVWTGCPSGSNCNLTAGVVRNESWIPNHAYSAPSASAARPSRTWPGGKEMVLSRKDFSHGSLAPLVVAAVRHAYGGEDLLAGGEDLAEATALGYVSRVWSRSVRGLRLRVQMKTLDHHVTVVRHMEGHITFQ